jgi:fatty acid amide hydrolase
MDSPLIHLGAAELARRIAARELSSTEVVEAHIARIEAVQPTLNAMVWPLFESARAQAREADAKQARGELLGPLHGVPFTVKEYLDMPGTPSTHGLLSRKGHRATEEDVYVRRMREAGGIPICKTNVPQWLLYYESDNPVYGRTRNPHAADRTAGGSSGGEGALVAAGASPIGLGSDIGGSIRIPSHFCGVAGIKPTTGRCDDQSMFMPAGQRSILAQIGPIAPRVEDLALGLQVLNGNTGPWEPSRPLGDWKAVDVRNLRVGFYVEDGLVPCAPAMQRAVREAAEALRQAGAQVLPWQPPDTRLAFNIFLGLMGGDAMGTFKRRHGPGPKTPPIAQLMRLSALPGWLVRLLSALLPALGQHSIAANLQAFGDYSGQHFWDMTEAQARYTARFAQAMQQAEGGPLDLILCPPCPLPAYTHGASTDLLTAGAYCPLYNLLGYPAGVVPVTRVRADEAPGLPPSKDIILKLARQVSEGSAGLPVGVQVVARPWREHEALAAMAAIEAVVRKTQDFRP